MFLIVFVAKRCVSHGNENFSLPQRYSQCPYNYPTASEEPYKVTLQVGQRKFVGIGHTVQSARHDAASK